MAEHYATLIEQHWPEGVVHLLGQSAGGWYVWAVATELLRPSCCDEVAGSAWW